jgi:predicted DNA-binding transcriptional regulator AlpA
VEEKINGQVEYASRVEFTIPRMLTLDENSQLFDCLLSVEGTEVVVMSLSDDSRLSISYDTTAPDPESAVKIGKRHLAKALGEVAGLELGPLRSFFAEPVEDEELRELVPQAEIARRLKLSRERVRQLAKREDFPSPAQRNGSRRGLYRWGEILEWHERRPSQPGRPRAVANSSLIPHALSGQRYPQDPAADRPRSSSV